MRNTISIVIALGLTACGGAGIEGDAEESPNDTVEQALGAPVWSLHETWEVTTPFAVSSDGQRHMFRRDEDFPSAFLPAFSGAVRYLQGGPFAGWAAMGRDVSPQFSGSVICYAQMALAYNRVSPDWLGTRNFPAAIEVIDIASWSFVAREPITMTPARSNWQVYSTPGWTSRGAVHVRAMAASRNRPQPVPMGPNFSDTSIWVDDLWVTCIPKPTATALNSACSTKCNPQCTGNIVDGRTQGIQECIQACTNTCVGRGHPF